MNNAERPNRLTSPAPVTHRGRTHALTAIVITLSCAVLSAHSSVNALPQGRSHTADGKTTSKSAITTQPLAGLVIALDPGHQLGNSNPKFRKFMAQKRFQGRIWKSCNTTGTATNSGYPEATFNWEVSRILRAQLESLGAKVPMSRTTNDREHWGPCTWDRGTFGMRTGADLMVEIHADGAPRAAHGFHIITPSLTRGWTDHIYQPDRQLADAMKRGMLAAGATPSTYIKGAISVRSEMMALNISQIPTVLVELGNMRNSREAALMTSAAGRQHYAQVLLAGIRAYLKR